MIGRTFVKELADKGMVWVPNKNLQNCLDVLAQFLPTCELSLYRGFQGYYANQAGNTKVVLNAPNRDHLRKRLQEANP